MKLKRIPLSACRQAPTMRSCAGCPWLQKPGEWWLCSHPAVKARTPPGLEAADGLYLGVLAITPSWCPLAARVRLMGEVQTSAPEGGAA